MSDLAETTALEKVRSIQDWELKVLWLAAINARPPFTPTQEKAIDAVLDEYARRERAKYLAKSEVPA